MIWKVIVEILVAFYPKKKRAELRHRLRYLWQLLYVKRTARKVGKNFRCGKNILISKKTYIGDNVSINGIFTQGCGNLKMGSYIRVGTELLVLTSNHDYKGGKLPFGDNEIPKDVIIEDCCWLGSRVTLLPGTHLHEGCIVQAGAVIRGDIPAGSIIGGNPAKVFAKRDMDEYKKLKEEGKFYINSFGG